MQKGLVIIVLALVCAVLFTCCKDKERCNTYAATMAFTIEPNSAAYSGLNRVGGYEYLTGGRLGIVVIRTAIDHFEAYERTCPNDTNARVVISEEWGSSMLECPVCGTLYNAYSFGSPMDGHVSECPLYAYNTAFDGVTLRIY